MPAYLRALVQAAEQEITPGLMVNISETLEERSRVMDVQPDAFLDTLFLKAMFDRFGSGGQTGHLYLEQYEIPQILLFDVLINQFPFVRLAHTIVNDTLAAAAGDAAQIVLLDVGIGRGIQTTRLMEKLQHHKGLQQLHIIGVEPFKEAIGHAQQAIREAAKDKPWQVHFEGINCLVEDLDAQTLQAAIPASYDKLIVNASLTLHHMPSREQRAHFFRLLHALAPDAVLLTEPDSDHMEPNWAKRVQNAYPHYNAVFSVIDHLDTDTRTRNGLKLFFGREIEDVVAHAEDQRYERHEPTKQWIDYCKAGGFTISADFIVNAQSPLIQISVPDGYLAMKHKGLNVLSLIHAIT